MNTTALRIEILIIGFQSSIWAVLLLGYSYTELIEYVKALKDVAAFSTVVLLGWCYSFGAAIDGLTGAIEDPKSLITNNDSNSSNVSILWLKYPEATKVLTQNYFDLRLLRSTVFNLIAFTIVSIIAGLPLLVTFSSGIASALVSMSWWRRRKRIGNRKDKLCKKADELA